VAEPIAHPPGDRPPLTPRRARIARPVVDLVRSAHFYRFVVGLAPVTAFADHEGFDGVVLALGPALELELVHGPGGIPAPTPTIEDVLVLWVPPAEAEVVRSRLAGVGCPPTTHPNPFWARVGASVHLDPDGYPLVVAPA
jgi:hypothetical protein